MEKQTELFKTSDIKSSAYLLTEGISIVKIIKSDPQKVHFCFPNTPEVKNLLQRYWTNRASANPRLLFDNFDYLKGLIHRDYEI
ncbi:MAG: hypothetical protein UT17_C0003G0245 [Candidatus Woesebacteria bacterium GW2011_GWB1_39_10]|uniref:DUF5659 domain-containing protein n=2 Tax=Candidatus Woeseibacteriota TaxID=1752722 RepID=A0A0G0LMF5_9BACT|nr:MAG: hypothetical protein UT17_C0003G0245 [Candidatus Woesebacteria bacterium GW2011_GWB1_39_10]KKS91182.1 MAG: hypothetical protein UV66_C0001G0539 [Candidatus Woesebacteria bacterium GW2011_GWA1_43_12]